MLGPGQSDARNQTRVAPECKKIRKFPADEKIREFQCFRDFHRGIFILEPGGSRVEMLARFVNMGVAVVHLADRSGTSDIRLLPRSLQNCVALPRSCRLKSINMCVRNSMTLNSRTGQALGGSELSERREKNRE